MQCFINERSIFMIFFLIQNNNLGTQGGMQFWLKVHSTGEYSPLGTDMSLDMLKLYLRKHTQKISDKSGYLKTQFI